MPSLRRTSVAFVEIIFVQTIHFLFEGKNGGEMKACLIFSSTEARWRDQFVIFQVGNSSAQDKSMTSKNDGVTETQ